MKWFKHMSCSHTDEKLCKLTDAYGLEGYGFYWFMLEKVSLILDSTGEPEVTYSVKKWANNLDIPPQTFKKLMQKCCELGLFLCEFRTSSGEVLHEFEGRNNEVLLTVRIPNLLKYRDEYSSRRSKKSGQSPDNIPIKEEEKELRYIKPPINPPTGDVDEHVHVQASLVENQATGNEPAKKTRSSLLTKQRVLKMPYSEGFERVWLEYPNRNAKAQAWWTYMNLRQTLKDSMPSDDALVDAIRKRRTMRDWQKDGGQYVPHMGTWLNGHGWEDVANASQNTVTTSAFGGIQRKPWAGAI